MLFRIVDSTQRIWMGIQWQLMAGRANREFRAQLTCTCDPKKAQQAACVVPDWIAMATQATERQQQQLVLVQVILLS